MAPPHINTTAVLAVIALALGIVQLISPLPGVSRVSPQAFFVVGALLGFTMGEAQALVLEHFASR